jgi:hypothetical protein
MAGMFERLQKKWGVNGLRLTLILLTFAIGGSATGFLGKKIMNALNISQDWLWAIIYIILVTLIWPMAVLLVSIPFGQFKFFLSYIKKLGKKMGIGN